MIFWGSLTAKCGKNIQVPKTDIHMVDDISKTGKCCTSYPGIPPKY